MKQRRPPAWTLKRSEFVAAASASALVLKFGSAAAVAEPEQATVPSGPHLQQLTLRVNGVSQQLQIETRVTLLDALRDRLGLTGTKKGCDQGTCGACTVLVNGRRIDSCLTLAVMHSGDAITTVEGLASSGGLHPLQSAFIEHDAFQCGYCTPGQIMSAVGMAHEGHAFDKDTIREQMSGNICRCGCYPHIVDALLEWKGSPP